MAEGRKKGKCLGDTGLEELTLDSAKLNSGFHAPMASADWTRLDELASLQMKKLDKSASLQISKGVEEVTLESEKINLGFETPLASFDWTRLDKSASLRINESVPAQINSDKINS
jgi:hypothetical protein